MATANPYFPEQSQSSRFSYPPANAEQQQFNWYLLIGLVVAIIASYARTLWSISQSWQDPNYSHGWLVPLFAAALIWMRREQWRQVPSWQRWVGFGILALGIVVRIAGTTMVLFSLDNLSIIICLLGAFVLVGGIPTIKWAAPAVVFLVFMLPLPRFVYDAVNRPLQSYATVMSHFSLETLGVSCHRDGNNITLGEYPNTRQLGVADQCSGLRMLTIFSALAVAIALISTNRPWWERLIIVASAVPIALTVNVIRIVVTGLLYNFNVDSRIADMVFHDLAGWIMMPMALGLLYLECRILAMLVIEEDEPAAGSFASPVANQGVRREPVDASSGS